MRKCYTQKKKINTGSKMILRTKVTLVKAVYRSDMESETIQSVQICVGLNNRQILGEAELVLAPPLLTVKRNRRKKEKQASVPSKTKIPYPPIFSAPLS
jgi:hypothetical protein